MIPRTVSGLVAYIAKCDPAFTDVEIRRYEDCQTLRVVVTTASANISLKEDIELPLVFTNRGNGWYILTWDISSLGRKDAGYKPYCFTRGSKEIRKSVTKQEDAAADMIGGRRHIGSGAIPGIKSDASNDQWQVEAKMATTRKSISVSIDWLQKITHEASVAGKHPMMYLTYQNIPQNVRMEDTWVVIPKSVFHSICRVWCSLDAIHGRKI